MRARLVAAAFVALAASTVAAGVDVEVPGVAKSKGTILPAGERETYRFAAPAGATVTATLVAKGKSTLDPDLALEDDEGDPIAVSPDLVVDAGRKIQWKKVPVAASGDYAVVVGGDGTGEYSLSLRVAPVRKFTGTVALGSGGDAAFPFAAPAGATLKISVKPAPGSDATPSLAVLDCDGSEVDLSTLGKATDTTHVVEVPVPGGGGDCSVLVMNDEAAGDAVVSVVVKPPKSSLKLDVRGATLGSPAGGETVVSRTVDAGGGAVLVDDDASAIDGAGVEVPVGAVDEPTLITVSSAPAPFEATDPDASAAGPAVDLQPSGIAFGVPVLVTLRWDLASVPVNQEPEDVRILVREDDGSEFLATPAFIGVESGSLTVEASGFSICIPVTEPGPPRVGLAPGGDQYWAMLVHFSAEPDTGGNDSRIREFGIEMGEVALFDDGTFTASLDERILSYSDAAVGSSFQSSSGATTPSGTYAYEPGGNRLVFDAGGEHSPTLLVTRDARYMAGRGSDPAATSVHFDLFLRKPEAIPAVSDFVGTWHLVQEEIQFSPGSDGRVLGGIHRTSGSLTFDGEGGWTGSATERETKLAAGASEVSTEGASFTAAGTYSVDGDGTLLVVFPAEDDGGQDDVLRLHPGRGLDVMFGWDSEPCGGCHLPTILVREAAGATLADLAPSYAGVVLEFEVETFNTSPTLYELELREQGIEITNPGSSTFPILLDEHSFHRDGLSDGGLAVMQEEISLLANAALDKKGKLKFTVPSEGARLVGAVTPALDFGILLMDPAIADGSYLMGVILVPAPVPGP